MNSERLKAIYLDRKRKAECRFPGSSAAGPARYNVGMHEKAWALVDKAEIAYLEKRNKEERNARYQECMESKRKEMDHVLEIKNSPLKGVCAGDRLRLLWTNGGSEYNAIVEVVRINAVTIKIKLVDEIPKNYSHGQSWAVPKIGTEKNKLIPLKTD